MLSKTINIIEPTLKDQSGHCYSFILSLVTTEPRLKFILWISKIAEFDETIFSNSPVHKFFSRRLRKIQKFFLLRKLLRKREKIFFSTAETLDLVFLKYLGKDDLPVYFYFHWFRDSKKKRSRLRKLSSALPLAKILVPTKSIAVFFEDCGFRNVSIVPYPHPTTTGSEKRTVPTFTHLLYAGAAREDKGFLRVVAFVEFLQSRGETLPVTIQITRDHGKEHPKEILRGISTLTKSGYKNLVLVEETPSADEFGRLFQGSICLQLYDSEDFKDRVSGITLDSLSHGAPIVATKNTWLSSNVVPYRAGLDVLADDYVSILDCIKKLMSEYSEYSMNARIRGDDLKFQNDAAQLAAALMGND